MMKVEREISGMLVCIRGTTESSYMVCSADGKVKGQLILFNDIADADPNLIVLPGPPTAIRNATMSIKLEADNAQKVDMHGK